ncbi:hypothetical protein NL676_025665 [Syzygium grande]|nr:hypothetical protein NL676_025665 [Syzygium grande]
MEGNPVSEVEYEIVADEEEHEELGGVDFKTEIVYSIPEHANAKVSEPMDINKDEEQHLEPKTKSEAVSLEEEPEQSESSSESSSSNPDWVP